jgi:hypothetical protein
MIFQRIQRQIILWDLTSEIKQLYNSLMKGSPETPNDYLGENKLWCDNLDLSFSVGFQCPELCLWTYLKEQAHIWWQAMVGIWMQIKNL